MVKSIYIGVDGGATKCAVRVEDEAGNVLGETVSGPANIRISVPMAWQSILTAVQRVLHPLTISLKDSGCQFYAGMGIAGCEIESAYQAFIHHAHPFHSLKVTHDAHAACLGAHAGKDGALIIAGTGVAGYQIEAGETVKVSGWGFPHDDIGSGAWLGLEAARVALQWSDGRQPPSGLAKAVLAHFENNHDRFVSWANRANSTAFAELAPLVVQMSQVGDAVSTQLMRGAARAIDSVASALFAKQQNKEVPLPLAMTGGIAPFLKPYLGDALRARLVKSEMSPEAGAILLLRQSMKV